MSAQMMNHSRRDKWTMLPGPSVKRKERDGTFHVLKPSPSPSPSPLTTKKLAKPSQHHKQYPPPLSPKPTSKPLSNNHLLAGYLAHEFLSKGTLFGQNWDSARAESVGSSRMKPKGELEEAAAVVEMKEIRYKEISDLMKTDGAHIRGIVNPTQLGRFLQLG